MPKRPSPAIAPCDGSEPPAASSGPTLSAERPHVSIIVPVHHRNIFYRLLEALAQQRGVPRSAFEVFVVGGGNFPHDEVRFGEFTRRIGDDFRCSYSEIGAPPGRARLINFGLSKSSGPIIWLLADDFIPNPDSLRAHLQFHATHADPRDAGVGGGFFPSALRNSFLRRALEDSGSLFGHSFTSPLGGFPSNFFYAANTSIKRSLIDRAGTFNEQFCDDAWDDYEYAQRLIPLGYRATYLAEARCTHEHRVNLRERMEHLRNAGHAAANFELLHPAAFHPWRNIVRNAASSLSEGPPRIRPSEWKHCGNFERLRLLRQRLDRAFAEGYIAAQKLDGNSPGLLSVAKVDAWLRTSTRIAIDCRGTTPVTTHVNPQRMQEALRLQRAGDLRAAEKLYWEELQENPHCVDALHMFGVIRLQAGLPAQASAFLTRALVAGAENHAAIKGNLGLCLAELIRAREREPVHRTASRPDPAAQRPQAHRRHPSRGNPLVSVIVPSYNHRHYVGTALSSIFSQTYRNVEVIVIDDGSSDGSPTLLKQLLAYSPFPTRLIARENRGAHHSINEGIRLARGEYVNVLNSDDAFTANRLERFVRLLQTSGSRWGFGKVSVRCEDPDSAHDRRTAAALAGVQSQPDEYPTLGFSLLRANLAISSGNLFMEREFAINCGLFRDFRYNHDWDFCLRAVWHAEPAYLPEVAYLYRLHRSNTIKEAQAAAKLEAEAVLSTYIGRALSKQQAPNPAAPCLSNWGDRLLMHCFEYGLGRLFPTADLINTQQALTGLPPNPANACSARLKERSGYSRKRAPRPHPSPRIDTSPQ